MLSKLENKNSFILSPGPRRIDPPACNGAIVRVDQRPEHPIHDEGAADLPGEIGRRVQSPLLQCHGPSCREIRAL